MSKTSFRLATHSEIPAIWEIIQFAIKSRKADGSNQWQDGYPNPDVLKNDIDNNVGYVLLVDDEVAGYSAILVNDEPEYEKIVGKWITNDDFIVFHRVAIGEKFIGQGLAKKIFSYIEDIAKDKNIQSVKADTNFDNPAMINLFEKLDYKYCGEVYFRGSPRKAYEKVLNS
mgnify:CR=1 FL=1